MAIVIVDYDMGNVGSIVNMMKKLGVTVAVTSDPAAIRSAERLILPGVGHFEAGMANIRARGLVELLHDKVVVEKTPVLGICLGMQLLFRRSEEGATQCLGVLPDTVRRLRALPGKPVPHMGWNQLEGRREDPLLEGIAEREYVYFVHTYAAAAAAHTLACTDYGGPLAAVVRCGNFWGTQFHPERSGRTGARLLGNFLRL
jgi:glutamine amidotransferase